MIKSAAVFCFLLLLPALVFSAGEVVLLDIQGTINPVVADYVESAIVQGAEEGAAAVILKMDTPGGLMESMRQIIKSMESAPFPIIVYIGDSGARAASAGAFITLAADVAIMANGTNIGAAHPVKMGQQEVTEDMNKKMTEDARAFIKAIANKHGRNEDWAQKAVTESISVTSDEALRMNVIDYVVRDIEHVYEILEGLKVKKNGKEYILTFEQGLKTVTMSPFKKLLNYISNPNFAYILMMLGMYGLIYEFSNPGVGLGAVVGGASLLLAALAFQIIPINIVGLLLIVFGVTLMIMDIWVPSHGILTIGGLASLLIGSFTLMDVEKFPVDISVGLILGGTLTTGLFFIFAAGSGVKIQSKKVTTGQKGMIGIEGEVRVALDPEGEIYVHGEIWKAAGVEGNISEEALVEIVEIKGNKLFVKEKH